jgi:hypothetical protein
MPSCAEDQLCAVELQKLDAIVSHEESSIVPALINFIAGFSSTKLNTGEPQS